MSDYLDHGNSPRGTLAAITILFVVVVTIAFLLITILRHMHMNGSAYPAESEQSAEEQSR